MFEIKKSLNFKNVFLYLVLGISVVILGLTLLITIDGIKLNELNYTLGIESAYTVVTQFGTLLFSPLVIYAISNDYKEKNIYFYEKLGYNGPKYYMVKVLTQFFLFGVASLVISLSLSLLFKNFSYFVLVFLKVFNVLIYFVLLSSLFAYIFDSFVKSYLANFTYWLIGNIISSVGGFAEYFCYYDAANADYKAFIKILEGNDMIARNITDSFVFNFIVFCVCLGLVTIFKKSWRRNGI